MKDADRISFGGGGLDRRANLRARSAELQTDPAALVVLFWRGRPLVTGGAAPAPARLALRPANDPFIAEHAAEMVFLGDAGEGPLFAADVSRWLPDADVALDPGPGRAAEDQPLPDLPGWPKDCRFADLRMLFNGFSRLDAECAATAKGILEWHRTHRFCAYCGNPSVSAEGGWRRDCPSCGRPHFPRTDPVVIMLVTHGNKLLIGRSPGWPDRFYSLLAGFMEPGETVAAAVRREVAEEVDVRVGAVRILASQPWPFPSSLMIGAIGAAQTTEITPDPVEIEDALWISREDLLEVFAGRHPDIAVPRQGAIAQFLMKMWLADRLD
jgi:NAD+ diphosphatase